TSPVYSPFSALVRVKGVEERGRTESWTQGASDSRSGTGDRPPAEGFRPGTLPFPCPHAPMLADLFCGGYACPHERGHAHPVRHRAGRPARRGATLAAGL